MENYKIFKEIDNFTNYLRKSWFPSNLLFFFLEKRDDSYVFDIAIHISTKMARDNNDEYYSSSFSDVQSYFRLTRDYLNYNFSHFERSTEGYEDEKSMSVTSRYKTDDYEYTTISELKEDYRERCFFVRAEYFFETLEDFEIEKLRGIFDKFGLKDYKERTIGWLNF